MRAPHGARIRVVVPALYAGFAARSARGKARVQDKGGCARFGGCSRRFLTGVRFVAQVPHV